MITHEQTTPSGVLTLLAWLVIGAGGCTYDYARFSRSSDVAGGNAAVGGATADGVSQGGTGGAAPTDSSGGSTATSGGASAAVDTNAQQGTSGGTAALGGANATTGTQVAGTGGASNPVSSSAAGGLASTGGTPSTQPAQGGTAASQTTVTQSTTGGANTPGTSSTQLAQGGTTGAHTTATRTAAGASSGGTTGQGGQSHASGGATTGAHTTAGSFDAEAGLVAHFAFDESTGTVAANLKDASKNGTYVGSCTHPTGQLGNAAGLRNANSSSSGTSDWIELPAGLLSSLAATTVSLWVRDLSTARTGGRLFDFCLGANEEIYFAPDDNDKSLSGAHLAGTHAGVSFVDVWSKTVALTDKNWHHIALTWSAASIDLYIDGTLAGSKANPEALPSDLGVTSPDWLGRTLDDKYYALYAEIDDLRVYDKALSASEIGQVFQLR
jgi:hypothetical protein